jgi:hypothetical protein
MDGFFNPEPDDEDAVMALWRLDNEARQISQRRTEPPPVP